MKISIAMTTYNGEKYIEKQLQSLISQSVLADEVIIADDCSKDNTASIVKNFIQKNNLINWNFYVNNDNLGFVKNFKNVINKTTGDIIFLCDQDDIWMPEKLESIKGLFFENPQAMAINSSFNFIDGDDKAFEVSQKKDTSNQNLIQYTINKGALEKVSFNTIIRYNISPGCTMAFRKDIKEILFNQNEFEIPHDWEINLIACANDGLYFYNKSLINYRIHNSNTIGIETDGDNNPLKISGDYYKRIQVLKCQKNLSELLKMPLYYNNAIKRDKKYILHFLKYVKLREEIFFNNKKFNWFKLWGHVPYIKQDNTVKTILGDLAFMLNVQKAFQKNDKN